MGRVGSGVACASCVAALRLYRDMLLCAIPPSGCVAGGGAGVAIAAVFAFLTDLYLEYFAGACTAGAGALSVIVAMAGFSGYFFDFVRRLRKIGLRAQCIADPYTYGIFRLITIIVVFRGMLCVCGKGVGEDKMSPR